MNRIWSASGAVVTLAYLGWLAGVFAARPLVGALAPGLAILPYVLWLGVALEAVTGRGRSWWSGALGRLAVGLVLAYAFLGYPQLEDQGRLFGSLTAAQAVHLCVAAALLGIWDQIARAQSLAATRGGSLTTYALWWLAVVFPLSAFAFVHPRIAAITRRDPKR